MGETKLLYCSIVCFNTLLLFENLLFSKILFINELIESSNCQQINNNYEEIHLCSETFSFLGVYLKSRFTNNTLWSRFET